MFLVGWSVVLLCVWLWLSGLGLRSSSRPPLSGAAATFIPAPRCAATGSPLPPSGARRGWRLFPTPFRFRSVFLAPFGSRRALFSYCSARVLLELRGFSAVEAVGGSIMFLSAPDVLCGAVGQCMILYWFRGPTRFDLSQAPNLNYFEVYI